MLDCPDVESLQVFEPEALKTLKALSPESRNSISACFEPGALSPKTLQLTEVLMSLSLKRLGGPWWRHPLPEPLPERGTWDGSCFLQAYVLSSILLNF